MFCESFDFAIGRCYHYYRILLMLSLLVTKQLACASGRGRKRKAEREYDTFYTFCQLNLILLISI